MIFKRQQLRYSTTDKALTPYQAAGQQWDDRIGSARVQARNWRLMAFMAFVLLALMSVALIWQINRATITPYIVEVDRVGGVRAVGPAIQPYQPTDAQLSGHLERFVLNVRSLPIDPIVLRRNWLEAYDYVTDRGAATLNEFARRANPFGRVGTASVAVDVTSVVRASDTSFQVRWVERHYTNGAPADSERWTALLTIVMQPPKDEDHLRKNPLGLYIDGLNWSRELDSTLE